MGGELFPPIFLCSRIPPAPGFDVMKQAPPALSKLRAVFDKRLNGGAMNTIYIGVDFHARQQTICYLDRKSVV